MIVRFLEPAQTELTEAVAYYNSREKGLGDRFAEEVRRTIESNPPILRSVVTHLQENSALSD